MDSSSIPEAKLDKKRAQIKKIFPVILVVVATGWAVNTFLLSGSKDKLLELSGRIEGYETDIGAKVAGKIVYIAVREGDSVKKGQLLAQLEDSETKAKLEGAKAQVKSYKAKQRQAILQIELIKSQIQEAELTKKQSQFDSLGRINQAISSLTAAQSQLLIAQAQMMQAESSLKLAKTDYQRYNSLIKESVVTSQQYEQVLNRWENAKAELISRKAAIEAAKKQINVAKGALIQAKSTGFNPNINQSKLLTLQIQLKQTESQLSEASSDLHNIEANQKQIAAQVKDLKIYSSINGQVITRNAEPGQVVAAGKTILTLVNLKDIYMRGYIPEGQIGRVTLGQKAKVYLDSFPEKPIAAKVIEIDAEASFTPENIYFKEDRVKQVFGVKIGSFTTEGFAKPGMPADAKIIENSLQP